MTTQNEQKLILENQFGEKSVNYVEGSYLPIPNSTAIILAGATAPVNGTTGDDIAGPGSIYIALDTGLLYQQTSLISTPVWVATGSANTAALLTGFVSGAGTVSASDSILSAFNKLDGNVNVLKNGTPTLTVQTLSAAGAINTTSGETLLNNGTGGTYAATLAAPSSQDGQMKVLKMGTATHTVTLACTNLSFSGAYTPSGTTTLTFTSTGDSAVLMAVGSKWVYLGGSAIAS